MSSFGKSLTCAVSLLRRSGVTFPKHYVSTSYVRSQSDKIDASGSIKDNIDKIIKNNKVVVFMKGVPEQPRCGFSNAVVQILRMHGVSSYDAHDVLQDESLRQGVKDYSNWPTIPQVYINGEFVGGCDIMIQMHQNGELIESLKKAGIQSALVEAESDAPNK